MPPEVVKAAAVRFELGFDPDLNDEDSSSDDETPSNTQEKYPRNIVWAEGVAKTDGNSAQRLHEVCTHHIIPQPTCCPRARALPLESSMSCCKV